MDRNYSQGNYDSEQGCYVTKAENGIWIGTNDFTVSSLITDVEHWDFFNYEGEFPSNYSLQQLIREPEVVAEFEKCKEEFRQFLVSLESSSSAESSSSSDETESSSSNETESSSSLGDDESSSSVLVESSSSEFVYSSSDDGVFVAGGDQVHSPDQIIREGLDNMENGKCYSLNPARGTQYGWMNTNAQDSWWWREVDCETGEKVDKNRVGVCPGFPLDNVPGNPKNACFAYNGTCYKCNPDRGSECSNSWLWQGTFTSANVGWWYEKVDCYDPFGEEDNCPDGNTLMKRTVNYSDVENVDSYEYGVNFQNNAKYYDVLGRKALRENIAKQVLYKKISDKFYKKSMGQLQQTVENIFERINKGDYKRGLFKRSDCGLLGVDYGIIENGQKVGGITCLVAEPNFSTPSVLDNKFLEETCVINGCEYKKVWVKVGTTLQMTLISIDDYVVKTGFVFPNGYVTTKEDHDAVEKHEKGHVKDFQCIANKFSKESRYVEIEVEECNERGSLNAAIVESVKPYLNEMQKEYELRFKRATERYHNKYGSFEYPESDYVCPSDL